MNLLPGRPLSSDGSPIHILVYGSGAVGLSFASCLIKSGELVDILARGDTHRRIAERGIVRTGVLGDYSADPKRFRVIHDLGETDCRYDAVLICTKTTALAAVRQDLIEHNVSTSAVVFLQNGWGNADKFEGQFPSDSLFSGAIFCGFVRPDLNISQVTACAGPTRIGSLYTKETEPVEKLCDAIASGGIPCRVDSAIGSAVWSKMLYNCAVNPLAALFGVPVGALERSEHAHKMMRGLVEEVFRVATGLGYEMPWKTPAEYFVHLLSRLIPVSRLHQSSMLRDILDGHQTEIDVLNGAIVRIGTSLKIETPQNEMVFQMLKFTEELRRVDDSNEG